MCNKMKDKENRRFDSAPSHPSGNGENVERNVELAAPSSACDAPQGGRSDIAHSPIATEAGHWYLPDGTPFYTVPRKTGPLKGQPRAVTIRDARPVNAVPSVTTILKKWDAPALNNWRERQVFDATFAYYRECPFNLELFTPEELEGHWKEIQEQAQQPREKAADRGKALHTAIEHWLLRQPYDSAFQKHINNIVDTLVQYDIVLAYGAPEKSFAHRMGFGGKGDWHTCNFNETTGEKYSGIVLDFKSKPKIEKGKKLGYINHYAQLASYREGYGIPQARGLNVFVGFEDAEVVVLEWTPSDMKAGWDFFWHLLGAWKIDNHYWPKL